MSAGTRTKNEPSGLWRPIGRNHALYVCLYMYCTYIRVIASVGRRPFVCHIACMKETEWCNSNNTNEKKGNYRVLYWERLQPAQERQGTLEQFCVCVCRFVEMTSTALTLHTVHTASKQASNLTKTVASHHQKKKRKPSSMLSVWVSTWLTYSFDLLHLYFFLNWVIFGAAAAINKITKGL